MGGLVDSPPRGRISRGWNNHFLLVVIAAFLALRPLQLVYPALYGRADLAAGRYSDTLLPLTNHENFVRLGWYLAWPAVWLGVAGICWLIWQAEAGTAVLLASGLLFTVVYLWNIRANPHQVYVMRRYVPVVLPFFLLGGGYLISRLGAIKWTEQQAAAAAECGAAAGGVVAGRAGAGGARFSQPGRLRGLLEQVAAWKRRCRRTAFCSLMISRQ